ncbi:MAG: hypothetical protein WCT51_04530 [Candidatus Shapirobacteria bacterium]|jgi:hypothetical protein
MEKSNRRKISILVLLLLGISVFFLINYELSPKNLKINEGWQLVQINNEIVPRGAIIIVDFKSDTFLPGDPETKRADGFVFQGRVIFYEPMKVITKTPVWIYFPEKYGFIQKVDNFSDECLKKLSNLTGKNETNVSEYFIGHP